jgi:hypothetical protein
MVQRAGKLFVMGPGGPLAARTDLDRATFCEVRSLTFFTKHDMPAAICDIAWGEVSGGSP